MPVSRIPLADILARCDAGERVTDIKAAAGVSIGRVYAILRKHRPKRPRSARTRTSEIPGKIRALAAQGIPSPRIAVLLDITPAYVYRVLNEISVDSKQQR